MATTKTIQPTGETITIPAMTDRPDASVFSTDVSRITDAVNSQNQALSNTAKSAVTTWGTSLSAEGFHQGILLISYNAAYIVWFSSTDGIVIRSLRTSDGSKTGNGSISFSADDVDGTTYTITRSGTSFSLQTSSSTSFLLIYR